MRLLITGAGGMLGLDLRQAAVRRGDEVTALARAELDITDAGAVARAVASAQPEAVLNCAAYTNVDGAEGDPQAADAVNGAGAGNVAAAAAANGAWTVHVSSDYVFDGDQERPYVESDPTGPRSAYGASKLAGELAVAAAAPGAHTIVRSSWLFGTGGPCFPATMLRLAAERDGLRVVDDQVGCPTFTGHLAPALLALAADPRPETTGIVHVAAAGECSWYEFAREIVAAAGSGAGVSPCATAEFPRPARRPAYSVLRTERGPSVPELPHWRDGLEEYMRLTVGAAR
jgi:dTDP-4-dehydrorhamnose reductase